MNDRVNAVAWDKGGRTRGRNTGAESTCGFPGGAPRRYCQEEWRRFPCSRVHPFLMFARPVFAEREEFSVDGLKATRWQSPRTNYFLTWDFARNLGL